MVVRCGGVGVVVRVVRCDSDGSEGVGVVMRVW